ncbi:MAG: hypothetical protein GY782_05565 [Gammaproteobacteria bacterium]|nr:hypothetical protein [Gammaproteobacteria bacterium]
MQPRNFMPRDVYDQALWKHEDNNLDSSNTEHLSNQPDLERSAPMLYQGGNEAHNNMPPHIGMNYCQKISNDNTTGLVDTDYLDQVIQPINSNLTPIFTGPLTAII